MAEAAVLFEGVWKKFQRGERHDSLRDLLPALVRGVLRRGVRPELAREEFWALHDVSFSVGPGEALGIIGPNGAGKTTVLRVLTRLLRPTRGRCLLRGRVGALIDVAGGFHPDLTGRENVFLRGAIVGMKRVDIARHFDSIVAFSGLKDFIDTPIKRYSSGMSARLGFSIAAHLQPGVLIIDEVLSVGDASFQKKAFDHIRDMVRGGIPAVVVTHQLEHVASLCTQGILLAAGRVVHRGTMTDCIAAYLQQQTFPSGVEAERSAVRLESITLQTPDPVHSGAPIELRVAGRVTEPSTAEQRVVGVRVRQLQTSEILFATGTQSQGLALPAGPFQMDVELQMNVAPGLYAVETYVWHRERQRDVLHGPSTTVRVEGGASFWGHVQLNARMRLAASAACVHASQP
ncbi:MAG: ABC transporter ATP-binding protein [Candidatus Eisenbacteria bacterium]